jgi:hypothetical protein
MSSDIDLKGPIQQADRLLQGLSEMKDRILELQAASAARSPTQELAKRAAEGGGGIATAAYAVGLGNHKNMLGQHAQRQDQSFKAMLMAAMGANQQQRDQLINQALQSEGATMGGDVLVTGDINIDNHPPQPASASPQAAAPQPQPQPAAQPAKSSIWPWIAGAAGTGLVGTAIGLGGSTLLPKPASIPAPANTSTTNGFNIRLLEKPPEGVKP